MERDTGHTPHVLVLVGATASGKTATILRLATRVPLEVISADSRQIYRYLDVGTAKPTPEERAQVPHHGIDIRDPDQTYSAGEFAADALALIPQIWQRGKLPCVVGGAGLYIHALCYGLFEAPPIPQLPLIRQWLQQRLEFEGRNRLYEELCRVDPEAAARYPDRNPRRLLRALEFYYATGLPLSEAQRLYAPQPRPFITLWVGLHWERAQLYDRINQRAVWMWQHGIIEETEQVLAMGYRPDCPGLTTHGYSECVAYLQGRLSAAEALAQMQRRTRQYAKRQLMWFRRYRHIRWIPAEADPELTAARLWQVVQPWLPQELQA